MDINTIKIQIKALDERKKEWSGYVGHQVIFNFYDDLCSAYLQATAEECAQARSLIGKRSDLIDKLFGYVYRVTQQIKSPTDTQWLRLGLAALSIANFSDDFRYTLTALAEIYVTAERAGIDPQPHFKEVANLSSDEVIVGVSAPLNKTLTDFHTYPVLQEWKSRRQGKNS